MADRFRSHSILVEEGNTLNTGTSRRDFVKTAGVGIVGTALGASPAVAKAEPKQGVRWGFLMDLHRCKGCLACVVACKTEFAVPLGAFRCAVKEYEYGRFPDARRAYIPTVCNHCQDPPCVAICPTDVVEHTFARPDGTAEKYQDHAATFKRPDGLVLIDYRECVGCGKCFEACPYGVRFRHARIPAWKLEAEFGRKEGDPITKDTTLAPDKCDWCVHRLEQGVVPSCVNTCPANARLIGDLNDPDSAISKRLAEHKDSVHVLLAEKETKPQCFYIRAEVENLDQAFRDGLDQRDRCKRESPSDASKS